MKKEKLFHFNVNRILLGFDFLAICLSYLLVTMLAYNSVNTFEFYAKNFINIIPTYIIFVLLLIIGKNYRIIWMQAGMRDYLRTGICILISGILSTAVSGILFGITWLEMTFVSVIIAASFILLSRMLIRGLCDMKKYYISNSKSKEKHILIIGAGNACSLLLKERVDNNKMHGTVIGLIDDDKAKKNQIINGYRVLGNSDDIVKIAEKYSVDEIIFAIPSATAKRKSEILTICAETGCKIKLLPGIEEIVDDKVKYSQARKVTIDDLLSRDPIKLNNEEISGYITDKIVMVTGGGGSIGSELCRQIMKFNPKKLIIIDIYENNAYDLQMELNKKYPHNKPEVIIASVRDKDRLEDIFETYRPYIVFHAAAHKHVPLMEDSPGEAIKNNVFGTYNVAKCADKFGVFRFVMISTDKAVNPTNVMGATKRLCEMIIQTAQKNSKTEFVAVRFGNVLGSNGSVVPLFERQIAQGGPVTVTHKEITRFFMTIPEAAQLVLQAAGYASGGEIFVLDMGEPVKIYDLAVKMINLYGYKPGVDINIEITGLRPGEKLYEELLMNEEGLSKTKNNKIFIGEPFFQDEKLLEENLAALKDAVDKNDNELIKNVLKQAVPTYIRNNELNLPVA